MNNEFANLCGWIDDPQEVNKLQKQYQVNDMKFYASIAESGKKKTVLLYKIYEAVTQQPFPVLHQDIGDCVSFGYALAVTTLMAVQKGIDMSQQIPALVATEPIYGGSRIEIGNKGVPRHPSSDDGSHGIWGAEWIKRFGILLRLKYDGTDLTEYSGIKAKNWGWQGVPDNLEPIAREHPVHDYALVVNYEEARDAIANGYPVVVCSNQGFLGKRDREGFAKPYGTWAHCMCFAGVDDAYERPGLLCCNSWGPSWIEGFKRHEQPDGSFWVDAEIVDKMLSHRESYAISNFSSFRAQNISEVMTSLNIL